MLVYYKANFIIIISLECNLFSPWYSGKLAHLALNSNHSLTQPEIMNLCRGPYIIYTNCYKFFIGLVVLEKIFKVSVYIKINDCPLQPWFFQIYMKSNCANVHRIISLRVFQDIYHLSYTKSLPRYSHLSPSCKTILETRLVLTKVIT